MGLHGLQLLGREIQRHRKQQALPARFTAGQLGHGLLVQDALVSRVLVHDYHALRRLEHDVRVEELEQSRGSRLLLLPGREQHFLRRLCPGSLPSDAPLLRRGFLDREPGSRLRHRGRGRDRRETLTHGFLHSALHQPLVAEAHLQLRRMHVHIHAVAGDSDRQEQRGTHSRRDGRAIPGLGSPHEEVIAKRPAVHEEMRLAAAGSRVGGTLHQPAHRHVARVVFDRDELFGEVAAEQCRDPLRDAGLARSVEQRTAVAREAERHVEAREREHGQGLDGGTGLAAPGAQELPASGRVGEEPPHRRGGPPRAGHVIHPVEPPSLDADSRATVRRGRLELERGHRGDGSERLPPEPVGRHADQIRRGPDLGRRVPVHGQHRILTIHSRTIVAHADHGAAAVLQLDRDGRGPRVERILDQLLHDRCRSLDDLTGRDLVDYDRGEDLDPSHQGCTTSVRSSQPRLIPSVASTQGPRSSSISTATPRPSSRVGSADPKGAARSGVSASITSAIGRA